MTGRERAAEAEGRYSHGHDRTQPSATIELGAAAETDDRMAPRHNRTQPSATIEHGAAGFADDRYSRQIRFAPIGRAGQQGIGRGRVAVVGMGALGSAAAQHLARAGVGTLRVIDRDVLELSNLQRQMLYTEDDVRQGLPKAAAAAERLRSINSGIAVEPVVTDLNGGNAERLLNGVDLIVDGTDNFTVRYLLNEISLKLGVPWIYGGVTGSSGLTMSFVPGRTPCFRCLFPSRPDAGTVDTCETAGVISPAVDMIASIQAAEALKWLSGNEAAMNRSLLQLDVWHLRWMPLDVSRSQRENCPSCGRTEFRSPETEDDGPGAAALCGRNTMQITPAQPADIRLDELAVRLGRIGEVERNRYVVRFRRDERLTAVLFPDGRALIQGTEDPVVAKRVYNEIFAV